MSAVTSALLRAAEWLERGGEWHTQLPPWAGESVDAYDTNWEPCEPWSDAAVSVSAAGLLSRGLHSAFNCEAAKPFRPAVHRLAATALSPDSAVDGYSWDELDWWERAPWRTPHDVHRLFLDAAQIEVLGGAACQ